MPKQRKCAVNAAVAVGDVATFIISTGNGDLDMHRSAG